MEELLLNLEKNNEALTIIKSAFDIQTKINKELREQLSKYLESAGIKGVMSPNNKFTARISTRKDLKIQDENTVRTYLKSNGLLDECLRLDQNTVKRYAKAREIPGIEEIQTTILTITEAKEEIEKIEDEETSAEFRNRVRGN